MGGFSGDLVLLLIILPTPDVVGFCFNQEMLSRTIDVDFQTRQRPSEDSGSQWELAANVTWQRRENVQDFGGYAVRVALSQTTTQLSFVNCSLAGLLLTNDKSYLFTGLGFGYKYYFGVSTINSARSKRKSAEAYTQQASPDCFLETGDREFCRKQSVEISGVPLDFQVDCVAPSIAGEGDVGLYTAVLSWTPPIQVGGNITDYELRHGKSSNTDLAEQIPFDEETKVYIKALTDLEEFSNFTATVRAFVNGNGGPKASLKFNTYSEQLVNNLSHPNEICSKFDAVPDGTTLPRTTATKRAPSYVAWIVGSILGLAVVGGALILCFVIRRRKTLAESKEAIFVRYAEEEGCRKGTSSLGASFDELREPDVDFQSREIDRTLLSINEKLGNGQFGIVYSGILTSKDSMIKKFSPRPVAVKSLKLNATRETKEDFLDEIKLIIDIGNHANILQILGCCTIDEPYYLITEFMKYGDLLGFLWKCRDEKWQAEDSVYCVTEVGQLQISRQIARGMEYLSNTRYYHGDLAARNVLVGEGLVVKISDFGMADDIYQRGYKRLGQEKKRPLKWVSLETNTKGTCSIKSDVWSFGIVLYEIYTLGGVPYPGMDGFEVVRKLEDGYRMEQPGGCPDEMYIVMLECWHENPDLRPTFTVLFNKLDRLLSELSSEYFTELDFDDRPPQNTYGAANREGGHYDTLKALDWSPVPRLTVEGADDVEQSNTDTSKC